MRNIVWKVVLILLVLGLAAIALSVKSIRLGKDLRGGVSLIYAVDVPDGANAQETLNQVITVLKDRVNPQGILDISMQPIGNNRIEVVMPLPSPEVAVLRKEFETALAAVLKDAQLHARPLDEAIRAGVAVEQFCGEKESPRCAMISELQETWNSILNNERVLDEARAGGGEQSQINSLEQTLADSDAKYESLRKELLNQSLDEARLRRLLRLPDSARVQRDPTTGQDVIDTVTGKPTALPSLRAEALAQLNSEYPELSSEFSTLLVKNDNYEKKRTGFDDPEDLKRLLRGAGVLDFRIAVTATNPQGVDIASMRTELQQLGPDRTTNPVAKWFPIHELKQWYERPEELAALERDPQSYFTSRSNIVADRKDGIYYALLYDGDAKTMTHRPDRQWTVQRAIRDVDQLGRPAVSFQLDDQGGAFMSRLTGPHVGEPMAIVLDGRVYSAPSLNSAIGSRGIIQGSFSAEDINYLIRVLAAGALEARLSPEPIAEITLGPSLGQDNLHRGKMAFIYSVIIVMVWMAIYYFLAGVIANIALALNALLIFGVMAAIDGTFTLPGMAGIALTMGMAVDANVLIYERIREELVNNKEDMRTAVRLGYSRAMSAIIDGNVTGLIVSIVLLYTATTEVKGFALTMIIGVLATLFTALFVSRVILTFYTEALHARSLPMLPTVIPAIHRALEPSISWMRMRPAFFVISSVLVIGSLVLFFSRGPQMYDTEFRGGLAMTMQTRLAASGEETDSQGRLRLDRPSVEARIHGIGEKAGDDHPALQQLRNATVLTVGEATADYHASKFQIKVTSPPGLKEQDTVTEEVVGAIVAEFGKQLDVIPALSFQGAHQDDHRPYTFLIESGKLSQDIGWPGTNASVSGFVGGVAILLDGIEPPVTVETALKRIDTFRQKAEFESQRARDVDVVGLTPVVPGDPTAGYTAITVVVSDPNFASRSVDLEQWDRELAMTEWRLVSNALDTGSSLQEVNSFSPAIASTLAANAIVAVILSLIGVLVYIWLRFGSLRYSAGAILALTHDVTICLGALALTQYLSGTRVASWLMLTEFRIDLNVIAALLTIIGYSLNDTIVVLDRIRENRGKRPFATPEIVNKSINQTFSRTVMTSGTTIATALILYVFGGPGIQPFAFTFLVGLFVGTYSSIAIASPSVAVSAGQSNLPDVSNVIEEPESGSLAKSA